MNVEGTFLGCKHAIPAMRAGGGGSIVNVSSTAAILGFAGAPAYTASKGAVQALTRSIAVHCMSRGDRIRCNAIYPHLAESPMSRAHGGTTALASADGVANAVLFLASDESSDLNGTSSTSIAALHAWSVNCHPSPIRRRPSGSRVLNPFSDAELDRGQGRRRPRLRVSSCGRLKRFSARPVGS